MGTSGYFRIPRGVLLVEARSNLVTAFTNEYTAFVVAEVNSKKCNQSSFKIK